MAAHQYVQSKKVGAVPFYQAQHEIIAFNASLAVFLVRIKQLQDAKVVIQIPI